jgi:integrase
LLCLAGYTGLTRETYALDLRQFASWCAQHHIGLFQARRADIECFARDLEARGRARATITRRLCTVTGFYKYAVEEELLDHSPAAHVRRPRLDYESHATGLDRNELGALLVAAGLGTVVHAARLCPARLDQAHAVAVKADRHDRVVLRPRRSAVHECARLRRQRADATGFVNAPSSGVT